MPYNHMEANKMKADIQPSDTFTVTVLGPTMFTVKNIFFCLDGALGMWLTQSARYSRESAIVRISNDSADVRALIAGGWRIIEGKWRKVETI